MTEFDSFSSTFKIPPVTRELIGPDGRYLLLLSLLGMGIKSPHCCFCGGFGAVLRSASDSGDQSFSYPIPMPMDSRMSCLHCLLLRIPSTAVLVFDQGSGVYLGLVLSSRAVCLPLTWRYQDRRHFPSLFSVPCLCPLLFRSVVREPA